MAGKDFGGVIRFRDTSGRNLTLRGTFNVMPSDRSVEGIVNQDGSPDRVFTPQAPRAEIVLADKNVDLATLMGDDRQDMTIVEDNTGVVHSYINAFYTGDPSSNRLNGEVSGVGIMAEAYRKLT